MKTVAVVCGGYSGEAVISLQSGDTVIENLPNDRYECYKIIVAKEEWYWEGENGKVLVDKQDFSLKPNGEKIVFDAVFLAIHGTPGEDGKIQGYFDMMGIPYSGCGVLVSAISFSKNILKELLRPHGISMASEFVIQNGESISIEAILSKVSLPCFVKPNKGGSSIGISRVNTKEELMPALEKGWQEDNELIIEDFIEGIEITCGVALVDEKPKSLAVTEIESEAEFFDYEAKYHDEATQEITPARIDATVYEECMRLSERIYSLLNCKGIIRIDYFVKESQLYFVELNTIPGFSSRSLIPQQAAYANLNLGELFAKSIEQALS